jgi:hypothetical protein
MADTLGLLQEALQLALDLGFCVREEPLGDLPGGPCTVAGAKHVLLNLEHSVANRLDVLLRALAADPRLAAEPKSRLLEARGVR